MFFEFNNFYREKNIDAELENLDDPEYGLICDKPIYTQGIDGSYIYLAGLKTSAGEPLTWYRLGSTMIEGINGAIDIYKALLPSGEEYKTLYINVYGNFNSTTAPQGFIQEA